MAILQVNSASGASYTSPITGESKTQTDKKSSESVFSFSDKNGNGIVDRGDFEEEETVKLALEKGFIGKSWEVVKNFIDNVLNLNHDAKMYESERIHEPSSHYAKTHGAPGYIARYDEAGNKVQEIHTDPEGNIKYVITIEYAGENVIETIMDGEGNLDSSTVYDKNGEEIQETYFNSDGTVQSIEKKINGEWKQSAQYVEGLGLMSVYDGTNGADFTTTINKVLTSEIPDKISLLEDLVPEYESIKQNDDGTISIELEDGTYIICMNSGLDVDGSVTIKHPDGVEENYPKNC